MLGPYMEFDILNIGMQTSFVPIHFIIKDTTVGTELGTNKDRFSESVFSIWGMYPSSWWVKMLFSWMLHFLSKQIRLPSVNFCPLF